MSGVVRRTYTLDEKPFYLAGMLVLVLLALHVCGSPSSPHTGRDNEICDIVVVNDSVSRQHCVIQFGEHGMLHLNEHPGVLMAWLMLRHRHVCCGGLVAVGRCGSGEAYITDLGSTNGTFVNKKKITPKMYHEFPVGSTLRLGESTRLFALNGPEELLSTEVVTCVHNACLLTPRAARMNVSLTLPTTLQAWSCTAAREIRGSSASQSSRARGAAEETGSRSKGGGRRCVVVSHQAHVSVVTLTICCVSARLP